MKDFVNGLKDFVGRNLTLINLVIAVCCLVSYAVTMYLLVYWTHWADSAGAYGGVLDYRWLGISAVFHVTGQNIQGQALFAFPDITSYFLIALIILNLGALRTRWEAYPETPPRSVAEVSLLIALICIPVYAWFTMMPIAYDLKAINLSPGGVLEYLFALGFSVYHVTSGHLESMGVGFGFDFTAWLLSILVAANLISAVMRWSNRQN